MTEEELIEELARLIYDGHNCASDEVAVKAYSLVLRHLINDVIDPRDSTRGIIYSLESRLKEHEE